MSYLMDPSSMEDSAEPTVMNTTTPMMMNMNPADQTMPMMKPEVLSMSAPTFKLVLPFASFDRSTPTKFAGSILNWASLLACLLFVYLTGKHGFMSGRTIGVYIVAIIFTVATTVLLSTSGYRRR